MRTSAAVLLALVATVLCASIAGVQAALAPPPRSNGQPHPAFIQMQFVEISKIDGVEQAFHADFYMLTTWATDISNSTLVVGDFLDAEEIEKLIWMPLLEFINQRDETTRLINQPFSSIDGPSFTPMVPVDYEKPNGPKELFVPDPDTMWVVEDQRYQCDFTTPLAMQAFPFDKQFMELLIESFWTASDVQIVWAEPANIVNLMPSTMPDIVGWNSLENGYFSSLQHYHYNQADYARLTIRSMLQRQPDYYLTKIVAGSMMLVFMCIWIYALAVDEADRMMGTLTVFGGLVTFLFVASGDVPKVPYQTRLDMFMLYSFLNVAVMLFIHGLLYFWREADVEDFLAEKHEERMAAKKTGEAGVSPPSHVSAASSGDVELASPSVGSGQRPSVSNKVFVNAEPHSHRAVMPGGDNDEPHWYLRKEDESTKFTLRAWWNGLHMTRKVDAIVMPVMLLVYIVGCSIILGRPLENPPKILQGCVGC